MLEVIYLIVVKFYFKHLYRNYEERKAFLKKVFKSTFMLLVSLKFNFWKILLRTKF